MGQDHDDERHRLRAGLRAAREALAPESVADLSAHACSRVLRLDAYIAARHVVVYAPIGNEVDPTAVTLAAAAAGKRVYFPRVAAHGLDFLLAAPGAVRPGRQSPPLLDGQPPLTVLPDTMFVVPGVGFDERGARLGRGRGCYDRALPCFRGAIIVGLAYELQIRPLLPEAPWDVRMDTVVTEARVRSWTGATEVHP